MKVDTTRLLTKAEQYRKERDKETGVVLFWDGEVYGWKNMLRDAGHERPGVIAIDAQGRFFLAEGGSDTHEAKGWVAVTPQQLER